jgi:Retrotransposon gag protein
MKSDAGKLREPEPFTGKDPKKLKAFIFQCQLYFHNSDFDSDSKKVTFALSYLRDVAQEWFEPRISGLTDEPLEWFNNWEAFLDQLCTNFGPYDETGDAEHELTNLRMRDNQRVSDYLVHFSGLAVRCSWGEPALRYRFYKGLPPRIKDELSKSEKPRTLQVLKQKVQNIDARYWERAQERSREQQYRQNPPKSSTSAASAVLSTTPKSTPHPDFRSEQKPKPKDSKPTTPHVDLSGKLDSKGKLTQQEQQRRIDKNLCLFCGGSGHRTGTCLVKSVRGRAVTTEPVPTPSKSKESSTSSKKD